MAIQRYKKQIEQLYQNPLPNVHILSYAYHRSGFVAIVMIIAPQDSIYKHHRFHLKIDAENFPFKAPKIVFLTKIYHPSIIDSAKGNFCICKMPQFDHKWSPTYSISRLLTKIVEMMVDPGRYLSCGGQKIVKLYKNNRAEFAKNAEQWCEKYCEKQ